mmetsp:Transcript_11445/g.18755  ORF Transcript_11445/g.18755 Transcript_11445/m.18755 type:complete len:97 (-) Transcript_11445:1421-1711(-)
MRQKSISALQRSSNSSSSMPSLPSATALLIVQELTPHQTMRDPFLYWSLQQTTFIAFLLDIFVAFSVFTTDRNMFNKEHLIGKKRPLLSSIPSSKD